MELDLIKLHCSPRQSWWLELGWSLKPRPSLSKPAIGMALSGPTVKNQLRKACSELAIWVPRWICRTGSRFWVNLVLLVGLFYLYGLVGKISVSVFFLVLFLLLLILILNYLTCWVLTISCSMWGSVQSWTLPVSFFSWKWVTPCYQWSTESTICFLTATGNIHFFSG